MPWCPKCKTEYEQGYKNCADCKALLVEELEKEILDHEVYLTTVNDSVDADVIEALLNSNGIPVLRKYREAGGYLSICMGNSSTGIDIHVPSASYKAAKEHITVDMEYDLNKNKAKKEENDLSQEEEKVQRKRSIRA